MLVKVYDSKGINFALKSKNAVEIVKSLLHSIKANYVVIDLTHADPNNKDADYVVIIDD